MLEAGTTYYYQVEATNDAGNLEKAVKVTSIFVDAVLDRYIMQLCPARPAQLSAVLSTTFSIAATAGWRSSASRETSWRFAI